MASLGARPADVPAGLGPAIGPDRYQVGDDVAGPARETLGGDADRVLRPDGTGRWLLDLPGANALLLAAAGVPRPGRSTRPRSGPAATGRSSVTGTRRQGAGSPCWHDFSQDGGSERASTVFLSGF